MAVRYTLDVGKKEAHFYNLSTQELGSIPLEKVISLDIPGIKSGDVVIIEDAHLRSKERNSLAQPFDYNQLVELKANADEAGITIRLFPQMSTPKARTIFGFEEKTDLIDVQAIASYVTEFPNVFDALKHFEPKTLEEFRNPTRIAQWEDRDGLTADINKARNNLYNDPDDAISNWIDANALELYRSLDEAGREMLGMKVVFAGKPNEKVNFNRGRLYTLVATVLRPDGSLRLRSDVQKVPFWRYVKSVYFAMTPYHMKGGVTASNVKWHWRRAMTTFRKVTGLQPLTVPEREAYVRSRATFDNNLRDLWRVVRSMVVAAA